MSKLRKDVCNAEDSSAVSTGVPTREAVAMVPAGRPVWEVAEAPGVSQQSLRPRVKQEALNRHERDDEHDRQHREAYGPACP